MKKIIISTNYSSDKNAISLNEIKQWVKTGKIFKHLFRYEESILQAHDLRLIPKPFASALLLRILSRGSAILRDQFGVVRTVTFGSLYALLFRLAKDSLRKRKFLNIIKREIASLHNEAFSLKKLYLPGRPVYLRTEMLFGLDSGGSVGHIAGVLNHLESPIFLTSDIIPTVSPKIETHRIVPQNGFADFKELPALHYNSIFCREAQKLLKARRAAFFYQRYSLNNFAGVQLAREHQVPLVLEYNGSEIWVSQWWSSPLKYKDIAKRIEMICLSHADLIVVVSKVLRNELVARGVPDRKVLVNPNGVDPERYAPMKGSEVRARYQLEGKLVLGFIGTFGKWHGAEVLAEAFRRLISNFPHYGEFVRLLMIGDGPTMPQVKKILAEPYCIFTGTIPQADGPSHLAACDILVSPHVPNPDGTPFFGSPTKLFEYMAMGKGIVASDLDQIGDLLKHNETAYMVKPGDSISLMLGLKALIDDEPARIRLGEAARKEVILKYTWKAHAQRILDRLQELCG